WNKLRLCDVGCAKNAPFCHTHFAHPFWLFVTSFYHAYATDVCFLLEISIHTATIKISPFTIDCQNVSMFIMLIPLSILVIINSPIMAPTMLPCPAINLVPPITQAAIASSSYISPALTLAALSLLVT